MSTPTLAKGGVKSIFRKKKAPLSVGGHTLKEFVMDVYEF